MPERLETRFLRYVRRHMLETVAVLYLIPLFWGGLVPFDFGLQSAANVTTDTWFALPVSTTHLPDMASNVALYLPFGRMVCVYRRPSHRALFPGLFQRLHRASN